MDTILLSISVPSRRKELSGALGDDHQIRQADSPKTADVEASAVDLWVVDLRRLRNLGIDVLREFKKQAPALASPVLLLAPESRLSQIDTAVWDHVDEVIGTPLKQSELTGRVRALLRMRRYSVEAEEARRRASSKYEALFDSSAHGILLLSGGRIVEANRRAGKLFGRSPEVLSGESISELSAAGQPGREEADGGMEALLTRAKEKGEVSSEWKFAPPSAEPFWADFTLTLLSYGGEEYVQAVFRDITPRREARKELEENRDLLRRTQDVAEVGGWQYDPESDRLVGTDELARLLGRSEAVDFCLEEGLAYYPPDAREKIREAVRRCLQEGEPFDFEVSFLTEEGEKRWGRLRGQARLEEAGPTRVVGTLQDITQSVDRRDKIESLYRATNGLLAADSAEAVVKQIHDLLHEVFEYPVHGVAFERDGHLVFERVSVAEAYEIPEIGPEPVQGDGVAPRAYRTGETIVINDLASPNRDHGDLQTAAAIPMGAYGALVVGGGADLSFDRVDLRLIEVLAAHAAVVLGEIEQVEALQKSEERFRKVFENAGIGVVILDRDGRILTINPALREMVGHEPGELQERPLMAISYDEAVPEMDRFKELVRGKRDRYQLERRYQRANGEPFWARVTVSRYEAAGEGLAIGMVEDIDAQKQRKREAERRARAMEVASDGMAILDSEGQYTFVNEAHARIYGYESPDAYLGESWRMCYGEEELRRFEEEVMPILKAEQVWQGEVVGQKASGARFDQSLTLTMLEDGGIICVVRDITARKERERKLREAKQEAEKAAQLKSAMLANMSHEVRTPLTSINGYAEILKGDLEGQPRAFAERIYRSGQRLLDTLDSVLQLSRLEAGEFDPKEAAVDLTDIADGVAEMLDQKADRKDIAVALDFPDGPVETQTSEEAVRRVLQNLLSNAIKFTPEGGRVTVCVRETRTQAVLEVEDTGVGIGEDALPEIFQAFQQESEGMDREYEGTGLGLSIVKELTEALGGTVEVESEKGEGTCFTVRLPKTEEKEEESHRAER